MGNIKLRLSTLNMILLFFTIIKISYVPNKIFIMFKYIVIIYLLIFNMSQLKKEIALYSAILAYTFMLTYSTHVNMKDLSWTISAFMSGLQMIVL